MLASSVGFAFFAMRAVRKSVDIPLASFVKDGKMLEKYKM